MTEITGGVALCEVCGELKGASCHCVDGPGLLNFLDSFRSTAAPQAAGRVSSPAAEQVASGDTDPASSFALLVGSPSDVDGAAAPAPSWVPPAVTPGGSWVPPAVTPAGSWAPPAGSPVAGWAPPAGSGGPAWPMPMPSYPMANARSNRFVAVAIVLALLVLGVATGIVVAKNNSTPSIPSLSSLFTSPPAPGYQPDPNLPLNGYLNRNQIEQLVELGDGGAARPLPSGIDVYGASWMNPDGSVIIEVAISDTKVVQTDAVVAGIDQSWRTLGGQTFPIGLPGRSVGYTVPSGDINHNVPEVAVVVARSRIAFMYVEGGADATTSAQATMTAVAQTTASSLAVDPGQVSSPPTAPTVVGEMLEVLGYSAVPLALIGLVTLMMQLRRSRLFL